MGEAEEEFAICADAIELGFSDSLQDISPLYRKKMKKIYNKHRQKKIEKYQKYLPILREHSAKRIKNHVYYQKFLARLHEERRVEDPFLGEEERWDVQLEEACQIMKDFVFLLQKNGELFNSSAFVESPS